jgi:hypothetical protein
LISKAVSSKIKKVVTEGTVKKPMIRGRRRGF